MSSMTMGTVDSAKTGVPGSYGQQLVTFVVDGQNFGISALKVRDVLRRQPLTRVPLAPPEIAGAINLRGHIVTAIDMRSRLGTAPRGRDETTMCVVVEGADEWFCLIVDAVGDVITIADSAIEPTPASVPDEWATMMRGVHRMPNCLLLLLDIEQLLSL